MVLIQNLEKVRQELSQTRQERDLAERRAQHTEALLVDSQGTCTRKEQEWLAEKRGLLGQIRDLEADAAAMKGTGRYVRKQTTSFERIRAKYQVRTALLQSTGAGEIFSRTECSVAASCLNFACSGRSRLS